MQPSAGSQTIADRVAETLNVMHDFTPIQPTGTAIEQQVRGKEHDPEAERDISMITNMSRVMVYAVAFEKALEVAEPVEARAKFMEQILRGSRSVKGWGIEKAIEMVRAVRPTSEEEMTKSRYQKLRSILKM